MRKQMIVFAGAMALLGGLRHAAAEEDNPPQPGMAPNPSGAPSMQNACPPGTAPVYQTPGAAAAPGATVVVPGQTNVYMENERERRPRFAPGQVALSVGGGVSDFVRNRINDRTGTSGSWDARLTVGTRSYAAFEASYMGTAGATEDVITGNDGTISTTQVAGSLRLNATRARIQPFVTAGGGWAHLRRSGDPDTITISIDRSKNAFEAPFGAGITGYLGRHGLVEARGQYNLIAAKGFTTADVRPDMWSAELRLGYAF